LERETSLREDGINKLIIPEKSTFSKNSRQSSVPNKTAGELTEGKIDLKTY